MIAYEGNEPFVFISYAHKDKNLVLPIIQGLQDRGFRVWYDQGIEVGNEWPDLIAEHLESCACVLSFVSGNFGDSHNCRQEFTFSQNLHKDNSIIYLEDPKSLRAGLRMQLSNLHALYYQNYGTMEKLLNDLSTAKVLKSCLGVVTVPVKPEKSTAEGQHNQTVSLAKKKEIANKTLSDLAVQKYGKGVAVAPTKPSAPTKPAAPSAEELYKQACTHYSRSEYVEAVGLYRTAAEMGYAPAQYFLGDCYYLGNGVPKSEWETASWYRKAAEQGYANAQYWLGYCYECGRGVHQSKKLARYWYQLAADQGFEKAIQKLKAL